MLRLKLRISRCECLGSIPVVWIRKYKLQFRNDVWPIFAMRSQTGTDLLTLLRCHKLLKVVRNLQDGFAG